METFDTLKDFPEDVQQTLFEVLQKGPVIPAEVVANLLLTMDIEIGTLMIKLLPTAASYARVPISNYHVGAVALGNPPGSLYLGSNMEFAGQALSFGVHGEQSAVNNAWLHGETGLQALAINEAPCGYCRQFLYELTSASTLNILLKANQNDPNDLSYTLKPLTYYLPDPFGPSNLNNPNGPSNPGLMAQSNQNLTISATDPLALAALVATNASYAPYSFDYAGIAIQVGSGAIYTGRYAENAAFNPSMSPLESALALMSMNEPANTPYNITDCVLVEASSVGSQRSATINVLSSVAPQLQVRYVNAEGTPK